MNTVHKFPVSQLPAKLRGDFKDDQLVTVTIESDGEVIPGFSREEIDELMAPAIEQEKQGLGVICENRKQTDEYFDAIRAKVDAKYQTK